MWVTHSGVGEPKSKQVSRSIGRPVCLWWSRRDLEFASRILPCARLPPCSGFGNLSVVELSRGSNQAMAPDTARSP